jgi:hypothetical protein
MNKPRVALIIAAAMLALLGSIAAVFADNRPWTWTFEVQTSGLLSYYTKVRVDAICDGPNRVYIARALTNDAISMSVVKDGCLRTPAENPKGD